MKGNSRLLTRLVFIFLVGMVLSGCAGMDSMSYVRQHKGQGTRQSLLGSEAELMDMAAQSLQISYTIIREPHALFARSISGNSSYAFYFYPAPKENQTEVEVVLAAWPLDDKVLRGFQKSAFLDYFSLSYINTRLLEDWYDPNVKEGQMFALSAAAYYEHPALAKKLIKKGADPALAIAELKEMANRNVPYLNYPANKKTYEKANTSVALLTQLQKQAKQNEIDSEDDASFQTALKDSQTTPAKPDLPEEARRFKVQAEDAVHEKKFEDAAALYRQALHLAPLWPEGHFNRALVLGETGNYESAIREMNRYLLLVPNAANARAARDKIYIWERKASEGS